MAALSQWATASLRYTTYALGAVFTIGPSLLYFRQNDLIYMSSMPPGSRTEIPTPEQFDMLNTQSIYISPPSQLPTSSSFNQPPAVSLHCYFVRPPKSIPSSIRKPITILMSHGNAGNIGHRLPIAKVLSESLGCQVLMLEYRGYGLSTGVADEAGLTVDAQAALDYMLSHPDMRDTKIVLYGQSLGGAVAIKTLMSNYQKGTIHGVILENTFTGIRKLIPTVMPVASYISWLCHQTWDSEKYLSKVNGEKCPPMLFLSGLRDEIVPPSMMKRLFEVCSARRKTWKEFRGGDHNGTIQEEGYFNAVWEFLNQEVLGDDGGGTGKRTTDVKKEDLETLDVL